MDVLVAKTVTLALEHGVLAISTIIVDSTHTTSRFHAKTAGEYVQEKSKLLRKAVYKHQESIKEKLPAKPTTNSLEEELTYTNAVLDVIEKEEHLKQLPAVKEKINIVKEVIDDIQEEANYGGDPDARKGRSEEHTSELQSRGQLVCRLLLAKKKKNRYIESTYQSWL